MRYFEDFTPGAVTTYGALPVTREAIVAYARAFDPQPFHLDEATARDSFVGALIASGWHSCSLLMRLLADHTLRDARGLGAPGIDEVKWLRPVHPGDTLSVRQTALDAKLSRSRPELGLVQFRFELMNQRGETVVEQSNWIMLGRRDMGPPGWEAPEPSPAGVTPPDLAPPERVKPPQAEPAPLRFHDEMTVGTVFELGSFHFPAEDIVRFAAAFDPQPFHLSDEAARSTPLRRLCASGWHTAGAWMRLMIEHRERAAAAAIRETSAAPRLGPSPGFRNLRWMRPVFAGEAIRYRSTIVELRASASRPGWGLAFQKNEGETLAGEPVFAFDGVVFWERRTR